MGRLDRIRRLGGEELVALPAAISRPLQQLGVVCVALCVLAACSAEADIEPNNDTSVTTSATATEADPSTSTALADNGEVSSLNEVEFDLLLSGADLLEDWSSQEALLESAQLQQEAEWAAEELMAACMQSEGFDYTPETGHRSVVAMIDPELDIGTRQWAEYYGFGASTMIVVDNEDLPDGIVGDRTTQIQVGDLDEQPNEQYRLSLDEVQEAAYQQTMNGEDGCAESAWATVSESPRFKPQGPNFALNEDETLRQRVLADQRWIGHEKAVQRCMASEGIEYTTTDDYIELVMTELMADLLNDPSVEYQSEQWYDILRQAQQEEVRVATALYDCDGDPESRADRLREILSTYPLSP